MWGCSVSNVHVRLPMVPMVSQEQERCCMQHSVRHWINPIWIAQGNI